MRRLPRLLIALALLGPLLPVGHAEAAPTGEIVISHSSGTMEAAQGNVVSFWFSVDNGRLQNVTLEFSSPGASDLVTRFYPSQVTVPAGQRVNLRPSVYVAHDAQTGPQALTLAARAVGDSIASGYEWNGTVTFDVTASDGRPYGASSAPYVMFEPTTADLVVPPGETRSLQIDVHNPTDEVQDLALEWILPPGTREVNGTLPRVLLAPGQTEVLRLPVERDEISTAGPARLVAKQASVATVRGDDGP